MEIPRGRGVLKAKILERMHENKLEFAGGGVQNRKPSVGVVWIFSGTAHTPMDTGIVISSDKRQDSDHFLDCVTHSAARKALSRNH